MNIPKNLKLNIYYAFINISTFPYSGGKVNNYFDRMVFITPLFSVKNFFIICEQNIW